MAGKILLFGFEDLPSILQVEAAARTCGAEVVPVGRRDYHVPLGMLAGLDTERTGGQPPYLGGALGGRMMVLCGLETCMDEILGALRQAGVGTTCLKAVLTPHNRNWDAVRLHGELVREHQAMMGR